VIDSMIDLIAKPTFGAWLLRAVISASLFVAVSAGAWWVFSRPRGNAATVCLMLIWLVVVAVWIFFLPILVQ
jgi:membrane protein YdbS with pleckstrin-like domain